MDTDSYEIGLENFDAETRKVSDLDQISFWNEEAKKLSWFDQWRKLLNGIFHLLNGSLVVRLMHHITH